jgi:drug/metabolite transporter (DMT)-like permease
VRVTAWWGVVRRSAVLSAAMMIYFGSLGFVTVAEAAAGLFTAPIWVLFLSVMAFGLRIGPERIGAVLLGFAGVVAVLAPDPDDLSALTFLPVLSGAFYAVSAIATREWCAGETALALTLGSFGALGLWGLGGIGVIGLIGPGDGFLTRGWVTPDAKVWTLCAVQAVGSLTAVLLLTLGYQLAEASKASIFEYSVLGFSAWFGWLLRGDVLSPVGICGLLAIALAGGIVAWSDRAGRLA